MNNLHNDPYNVENYSDEDLYKILDINNPSDRELEARINSLIFKYSNMGNESGNKLADFFSNIYDRFFVDIDSSEIKTQEESPKEDENIDYNFDLEYSKGSLNPLLQQTTKRIVSIDSQYRDDKSSLTSDYTFNLSDPLRDVVSLRLYSIQIPYTWYTINSNYGSNFFYIKGNVPGNNDGNHDYKVEIAIGNYTATELITAVNNSLIGLSSQPVYSDTNFGNTTITYDYFNSKSSINLDITKNYNENTYVVEFQTPSPAGGEQQINTYLGLNRNKYYGYRLYSNLRTLQTSQINTNTNLNNKQINNSNNFIRILTYVTTNNETLIQNLPNDYISGTEVLNIPSGFTVNNDFTINLTNGVYSRSTLTAHINTVLQNHERLSNSEFVEAQENNIGIGTQYSHYYFNIRLNRFKNNNVVNQKTVIIFPKTSKDLPIFVNIGSLYAFDNFKNELGTIQGESEASIDTLDISGNQSIVFSLLNSTNTIFDTDSSANKITLEIPSNTYTTDTYVDNINTIISDYNATTVNSKNPNGIFNLNNTRAFINNETELEFRIDINKQFDISDFDIHVSNTLYDINYTNDNYFTLNGNDNDNGNNIIDLSLNNTITNSFSRNAQGYKLEKGATFLTLKPKENNGLSSDLSYNFVFDSSYNIAVDMDDYYEIKKWKDLKEYFKLLLTSKPEFSASEFRQELNDTTFDITLVLQLALTENNYRVEFKETDINGNPVTTPDSTTWKDVLKLEHISYDISSTEQVNNYYTINGTTIQSTPLELTQNNNKIYIYPESENVNSYHSSYGLYDSNYNENNQPNGITLTLDTGDYTRSQLINTINSLLTITLSPNGDAIALNTNISVTNDITTLSLNINKSYTSNDYRIVFYDPNSFVTFAIGNNVVTSTTWDATLGWTLGFRVSTEYYLSDYYNATNNNYIIIGDNVVSVNLYSYFLITLDDYNQNHLNDGVVTTTQKESNIELPNYATRATLRANAITGEPIVDTIKKNGQNMTQKELYSAQQVLGSKSTVQNEAIITTNTSLNARTVQYYSKGPFAKNVFALLPLKLAGQQNNTFYVDYGGTLQNQERTYFGPVNINRMTVKLMNDKGELVNLNGANWSFSFICEQLYQQKKI